MTAGRSLADDGRRLSATERRSGHAAAWAACGIFSIAIGATQLGSLEHEIIDMDEATFIVMAKDVLNGNLPYVELFDLKPPMLFFMLAAAMASFGESLLTVRLFGALCLLTSCMAVFAVARRSVEPTPAALAVLLLVAVQSVKYGQYLSTELPATAMLMTALWVLVARPGSLAASAAAGLLMSLATLTRSNLGIVAVAFAAWLGVASLRPSLGVRRWAALAFVVAGLTPPVLLALIYWRADALPWAAPCDHRRPTFLCESDSERNRVAHLVEWLGIPVAELARTASVHALHVGDDGRPRGLRPRLRDATLPTGARQTAGAYAARVGVDHVGCRRGERAHDRHVSSLLVAGLPHLRGVLCIRTGLDAVETASSPDRVRSARGGARRRLGANPAVGDQAGYRAGNHVRKTHRQGGGARNRRGPATGRHRLGVQTPSRVLVSGRGSPLRRAANPRPQSCIPISLPRSAS